MKQQVAFVIMFTKVRFTADDDLGLKCNRTGGWPPGARQKEKLFLAWEPAPRCRRRRLTCKHKLSPTRADWPTQLEGSCNNRGALQHIHVIDSTHTYV